MDNDFGSITLLLWAVLLWALMFTCFCDTPRMLELSNAVCLFSDGWETFILTRKQKQSCPGEWRRRLEKEKGTVEAHEGASSKSTTCCVKCSHETQDYGQWIDSSEKGKEKQGKAGRRMEMGKASNFKELMRIEDICREAGIALLTSLWFSCRSTSNSPPLHSRKANFTQPYFLLWGNLGFSNYPGLNISGASNFSSESTSSFPLWEDPTGLENQSLYLGKKAPSLSI